MEKNFIMVSTLIIIVCIFTLSGFLLSRVFVYLLIRRQSSSGSSGIIGALLKQNAEIIGNRIAEEVLKSPNLSGTMNPEVVLQKLRPDIELHIDHFLEVKLKSVFPLLSQFIGAKTQGQMKTAFMEEMDRLFPNLMQKLSSSFLSSENLTTLISERIAQFDLSSAQIQQIIRKKIQPKLDLFFATFMLIAGITCDALVFFLTK